MDMTALAHMKPRAPYRRRTATCRLCGRAVRLDMPHVRRGDEVAHMDCMHRADAVAADLPWTREMCEMLPRPCPVTECHYYWAQNPCGARRPSRADGVMVGCYLDHVEAHPGGETLEDIGELMGITRERVRQIEASALRNLRHACEERGIDWQEFCHALGMYEEREGALT